MKVQRSPEIIYDDRLMKAICNQVEDLFDIYDNIKDNLIHTYKYYTYCF